MRRSNRPLILYSIHRDLANGAYDIFRSYTLTIAHKKRCLKHSPSRLDDEFRVPSHCATTNTTIASMAVPLNGTLRAIAHCDINDDASGTVPYVNDESKQQATRRQTTCRNGRPCERYTPLGVNPASYTPGTVSVCQDEID